MFLDALYPGASRFRQNRICGSGDRRLRASSSWFSRLLVFIVLAGSGVASTVHLLERVYETGVRIGKSAFRPIAE